MNHKKEQVDTSVKSVFFFIVIFPVEKKLIRGLWIKKKPIHTVSEGRNKSSEVNHHSTHKKKRQDLTVFFSMVFFIRKMKSINWRGSHYLHHHLLPIQLHNG